MVEAIPNRRRWLPPKFVGTADLGRACGPYLDPMDSVCLRTASVQWKVPGKYGPHGELCFFPIQKELATMPGSETFCPFLNADIHSSLCSADVLKKCALIALRKKEEAEKMDVMLLIQETNGNWAARVGE